jgi:hypothetical protein
MAGRHNHTVVGPHAHLDEWREADSNGKRMQTLNLSTLSFLDFRVSSLLFAIFYQ